ncbi:MULTISPECIES: YdcF family protein [Rossellomorea]|uniref:YdcF family protein n=1 Tax=Rossellomorea TaxID=2837508 RepID=UPI001CCB20AD|nr:MULTISPECIES: YdcF family protein [Rossellomorea]MCA0149505.1 YdcF family protein [Rossellomorea vietnamensis]WGG46692.1 YdcF family protein [Rossellomorea sp. DA94]
MYISKLNHEHLTDDQMSQLLFSSIHDDQLKGDCIFVAGSSKAVKYRLPKAVELYKEGRAGKILFSGGVKWPENEYTEALQLKKEAISLGVSEKDILTEDLSLHTLENVLASLLVLDREFHLHNIRRLLVVTTSYHMRRLHLTLKTYMPDWISFTLCAVDDDNTNEDNWFRSETGVKRVHGETEKLIRYVKQGALEDEDIDIHLNTGAIT